MKKFIIIITLIWLVIWTIYINISKTPEPIIIDQDIELMEDNILITNIKEVHDNTNIEWSIDQWDMNDGIVEITDKDMTDDLERLIQDLSID